MTDNSPTVDVEPTFANEDAELLQRCRQGDAAAWSRLLDKYERLVYSIGLNHGLSVDDAADIAQLTFTYFLESVDSLRDDSNIGGWLATVARRHTWRVVAKQQRVHPEPVDSDVVEILLPTAKTANPVENWELAEWLNQGLNRISNRCRALLTALYLDPQEPSYTEIAAQLEMAEGSIGPTRARCLERLRQMLQAS